jgi:hypothetical protein
MTKLNSAKDAIKQAREAGYDASLRITPCDIEGIEVYHVGDTLLDPLFWQTLGKARGWNEEEGDADGSWFPWMIHAQQWFKETMYGGDETKFWQSLP